MPSNVAVLDVLLHGEPVGTLTRVEGERTLFAFNQSYVDDPTRPTLSLGFKDKLGELMTAFRPVQTKLMPFFSNLLPEGRMRTYLADRAGVNSEREFFLLWALGKDLPGAITVEPADGAAWLLDTDKKIDALTQETQQCALRFSLAGVQLKFSAVNEARAGLTVPAHGAGGSWIVKLPSREFARVPENEFSMMTLARLVGIEVPPIQLIDLDTVGNLPKGTESLGAQAFAIERFDRLADGSKVHAEDFAQLFGVFPQDKYKKASYANIARVIGAEGGNHDIAEFIRRLTFNTLIGNADMHLKNWSMLYRDRRHASLSPAYDFVATIAYLKDDSAALTFSRTRRFDGFSEDELAHLAARAKLPETLVLDTARETVQRFHEHWNAEKKNLPLDTDVAHAVEKHIMRIPIAQ